MVARQALVALAIVAGGAVAAFGVYTFGWHETTTRTVTVTTTKRDPYVKTVKDAAGTYRIYTLRYGDIVVRPGASLQCGAYQEVPDLHFGASAAAGTHSSSTRTAFRSTVRTQSR